MAGRKIFNYGKKPRKKRKAKARNHKPVYLALAGIGIVAVLVWFIIHFSVSKDKQTSPLAVIPPDAAMIIEIKQASAVWTDLSENSAAWNELCSLKPFAKINSEMQFLDSLFKTNDCATSLLDDHKLYISFHLQPTGEAACLFTTDLPRGCDTAVYRSFILQAAEPKANSSARKFMGCAITEIALHGKADKFYYTVTNNVFACSFQPALIEAAIKQQKKGSPVNTSDGFSQVLATAGKKVDANLYINYQYFPQLFASMAGKSIAQRISELAGFAAWSALDMNLKKDAILCNGYTSVCDTANSFAGLFLSQLPHEITMPEILPASTASFVYFGFSDFNEWYLDYKEYLKNKGKQAARNAGIAKINYQYHTGIEKRFASWQRSEMALVTIASPDSNSAPNIFAVIKAANITEALASLGGKQLMLEQKSPSKTAVKAKTKNDKKNKNKTAKAKKTTVKSVPVLAGGNKIYETEIPNALPAIFGKVFDGVEGKYFAQLKDYIIFANSVASLTTFLEEYAQDRTLSNNNTYVSFAKNISSQANIFVYSDIHKSLGIYKKYANEDISKYIKENTGIFNNFGTFAYQLKAEGKMFYTNICLQTGAKIMNESSALWTIKLDTTVYSKPQVISDIHDKSKKVIAFDNAAHMYLINKDGSLQWKIQLKEKPIGDVFVIDYFGNNKSEYMFNTASNLYLIDKDGKDVDNFPFKLTDTATAAMIVSDCANNKDYRLFVPCGKKIYCYNKRAQPANGWTIPVTTNNIYKEISVLKFAGNYYLFAADEGGNIYMYDRKGAMKLQLKTPVKMATNSKFYITQTLQNSKQRILTTDTAGDLVYISIAGDIDKKSPGKFSPEHYFLYENLDNDNSNEYIFFDNNVLKVFDKNLKQICNYTLPTVITEAPFYTNRKGGGEGAIGFVNANAGKIYLVQSGCKLYKGFPLEGSTPFTIESLNNDATLNLVVGLENRIYNYSFQ